MRWALPSAVDLGYEMAESGLVERLAADLTAFHARLGANAPRIEPVDAHRPSKDCVRAIGRCEASFQ